MKKNCTLTTLWVSYKLTQEDVENANGNPRVECFTEDPRLEEDQGPFPDDYGHSGYDRGHMANDADMKDVFVDQLNSYVMTNMSPQFPRVNRVTWRKLEDLARKLAKKYGEIYVTSGAIFDRTAPVGRDADASALHLQNPDRVTQIAVPSAYFKQILRRNGTKYLSLTFLIKNKAPSSLFNWLSLSPNSVNDITTLNHIEALSNLKLYPTLDRSTIQESISGEDWGLDED